MSTGYVQALTVGRSIRPLHPAVARDARACLAARTAILGTGWGPQATYGGARCMLPGTTYVRTKSVIPRKALGPCWRARGRRFKSCRPDCAETQVGGRSLIHERAAFRAFVGVVVAVRSYARAGAGLPQHWRCAVRGSGACEGLRGGCGRAVVAAKLAGPYGRPSARLR